MSALDPRSLIFAAGLLSLACALVIGMMARTFPPSIRGLRPWALGCLFCLLSSPLFMARDWIPDFYSIVVANGCFIGGMLLQYAGLGCFLGQPVPRRVLWSVWALVMVPVGWFALVQPSYPARMILIGFVLATLFALSARRLLRAERQNYASRFTAGIYLFIALIPLVRSILALTDHHGLLGTGLLDPVLAQRIYLAMFSLSGMLVSLGFILMAHERLHDLLRFAASHDILSGALNHGAILEALEREIASAQRHGHPLSVLMLDLDHFKQINDRHGHLVGDRVIGDFAARIRAQLRQPDSFGRYGGEEFLVLLPHTGGSCAWGVAERIRAGFQGVQSLPPYTASIGVAALQPGQSGQDLLAAADAAMYRAKAAGRNRVVSDDPVRALVA